MYISVSSKFPGSYRETSFVFLKETTERMPNKVEGILWRRLTIKTRTLKTDEETHRKIRYV